MRALVLGLAFAACGGGSSQPSAPSPVEPSPALGILQDSADIDGRIVGAAGPQVRATAIVVFASWCSPCRQELHILGELVRDNPALRVIGINAYEEWGSFSDEQRLRAYLGAHAPWLQVVPSTGPLLAALGGVPKIPSLFLFNAAGQPVAEFQRVRRAPPGRDELAAAIEQAMACDGTVC